MLEYYEAVVEVQLLKGIGEIDEVDVKIDENIKGEKDANTPQNAQIGADNTHTCAEDNVGDKAAEKVQDAK